MRRLAVLQQRSLRINVRNAPDSNAGQWNNICILFDLNSWSAAKVHGHLCGTPSLGTPSCGAIIDNKPPSWPWPSQSTAIKPGGCRQVFFALRQVRDSQWNHFG